MLLLGPILFQDFEVPEKLTFGGAQSLTIHRLPGGARVIDAMGRDDADMRWSGIFSGPFASERARTLDLLRVDGEALSLTWDAFSYAVVIAKFEADFSRASWIPYRLTCTVLADDAAQLETLAISLAALVVSDAATASGYDPSNGGLQSWLSAPDAAVVGTEAYTSASSALQNQRSALATRMAAQEAAMLSPADARSLTSITVNAGNLAATATAAAYVNRASTNLSGAST